MNLKSIKITLALALATLFTHTLLPYSWQITNSTDKNIYLSLSTTLAGRCKNAVGLPNKGVLVEPEQTISGNLNGICSGACFDYITMRDNTSYNNKKRAQLGLFTTCKNIKYEIYENGDFIQNKQARYFALDVTTYSPKYVVQFNK